MRRGLNNPLRNTQAGKVRTYARATQVAKGMIGPPWPATAIATHFPPSHLIQPPSDATAWP